MMHPLSEKYVEFIFILSNSILSINVLLFPLKIVVLLIYNLYILYGIIIIEIVLLYKLSRERFKLLLI